MWCLESQSKSSGIIYIYIWSSGEKRCYNISWRYLNNTTDTNMFSRNNCNNFIHLMIVNIRETWSCEIYSYYLFLLLNKYIALLVIKHSRYMIYYSLIYIHWYIYIYICINIYIYIYIYYIYVYIYISNIWFMVSYCDTHKWIKIEKTLLLLVVKSNLSACSGSAALSQLNPVNRKGSWSL